MADIKCVITYPNDFITEIGEFEINRLNAKETIVSSGTLHVIRKKVNVSAYLHVVGMIFGPKNLTCTMDVFLGTTKVNSTPVKSKFKKKSGGYLFNWSKI